MKKLYFSDIPEEIAHSLEFILEEMKEREIIELIVSVAERSLKSDYFYCKDIDENMDKTFGECGKQCESYQPKNGKWGCCKYREYIYEPGKEFTLTMAGKLIPISEDC
jgi:hypothetical protein